MIARLAGAWVLVAVTAVSARAGVELGPLSPRAIGHAGATVVSDDGAAAAFRSPAAIARRDVRRAQLAGLALDDEAALITPDHPRVSDVGGATLTPTVGAEGHLGPLVLAVAFATTELFTHELPTPALDLPADDVARRYPHRYDGVTASWQRRSLAAAAALRPTDWLAVGVAITLGQVDLEERRRLWAGFAGRDPLAQPGRDLDVTIAAGDGLVPGAAIGALIAPLDTPLELAIGVAWSDDVRADGEAVIVPTADAATVRAVAPRAQARFGSALTTSLGVRWLGERYAVEGAATWIAYPTGDDPWTLTGVDVVDQSGATARLTTLPSRFPRRAHGTLAAAVDLEIIPAFAWLALGYRWASAASPGPATSTVGAALGGHTLAVGLELAAGDATITIGVARQLARTVTTRAPGLPLDNPFPGGVAPANLGDHEASLDLIGVGLELTAP
ncbi:MAG: hypothetical protein IPL61_08555 [Myxococcales bacterium]|nr:hypothetical protein [Myxococcales bacterium]